MLARLPQKRRIVLVDDEDSSERAVARALTSSFPDIDVCGIRDAQEALRVLDDEQSRLLIADVQAHAFDALALAASERKRPRSVPVIAMGSVAFRAFRKRASALGAAAWLEKPLQHDRLVGLVERLLVAPTGFNGEIAVDGLPELVQLLCMANTTGALHIDHGAERGTIWFEQGAIVHAQIGRATGVRSFRRMLKWTGGVFALDRHARPKERSIELPAMQLLLEGVHLIDEEVRGTRPESESDADPRRSSEVRMKAVRPSSSPFDAPSTAGAPSPEEGAPATQGVDQWTTPQQKGAECFERGMQAVRGKRYEEALREWERAAALDPDNRIYQANLRRLRDLYRRRTEA